MMNSIVVGTKTPLDFVKELMEELSVRDRPSDRILNCGLRFDHFEGPFRLLTITGEEFRKADEIADAIDLAILESRKQGVSVFVYDDYFELVYEVTTR